MPSDGKTITLTAEEARKLANFMYSAVPCMMRVGKIADPEMRPFILSLIKRIEGQPEN